jgi:hypothetical protein
MSKYIVTVRTSEPDAFGESAMRVIGGMMRMPEDRAAAVLA